MGTDIHCWVEVRDEGGPWRLMTPIKTDAGRWLHATLGALLLRLGGEGA
jgi:hypothetical protein